MSDTRYTSLSARIKTKLQQVTKLVDVYDYPMLEAVNYPYAYFVPADGESSYQTTNQDERVYAFDVYVFYETKNSTIQTAISALYDAVDDVLDKFATDRQLSDDSPSMTQTLINNGYLEDTVVAVEPVSSGWEEVVDKNMIRAKISLKVRVLISNL